MNKFKKSIVILSTVSFSLFFSIGAFRTNAIDSNNEVVTLSNIKDPNGDGVQDLFDSIYIRDFLYGKVDTTNYNEFDINNNNLITLFDAWIINARSLGILPTPANIENSSSTSDIDYYKHDCTSTNQYSYTSYTLSRPLNNNNSLMLNLNNNRTSIPENYSDFQTLNNSPRLVPNDVDIYSNTAVVSINSYGTGFIISDHVIVTAAHCVLSGKNDNNQRTFGDFEIRVMDEDGYTIIDRIQPKFIHVPKAYYDSNNYDVNNDYALIYVEKSLSEYGFFSLGIALDDYITNQGSVTVAGFPIIEGIEYGTGLRVTTSGRVCLNYSGTISPYRLYYTAPTEQGGSGGPVFFNENYTYNDSTGINRININSAIGINCAKSGSLGSGVRFDEDLLYFYYSNPYVN